MSESVKLVTFINIIFVVILMLSGSLDGFIGDVAYFLAFIIPIAIGFYSSFDLKRKREEIVGVAEPAERLLSLDKNGARLLLPLVFPVVTVVFLVSLVTSLVLTSFGVQNDPVEDTGLISMLLSHALLPALFEEALFRYIPMKVLMPYSRRWCVIYSAFTFALIHCSFFQMPYAFIAGIIFMAIDVALGSVWPSVILHLVNNTVSVIGMRYCTTPNSIAVFVVALLLLSAVSLLFALKERHLYKEKLLYSFDKGEGFSATYAPFALAVICCYIATISLLQ